jgi:hypothetical protein
MSVYVIPDGKRVTLADANGIAPANIFIAFNYTNNTFFSVLSPICIWMQVECYQVAQFGIIITCNM